MLSLRTASAGPAGRGLGSTADARRAVHAARKLPRGPAPGRRREESAMAEPAAARPAEGDDRSVGDLVSEAIRDLTQLVKYETDLAKAELRADLQRAGLSGALLAIAAFAGFLVLVMLCFAMAAGLVVAGLP